MSAKPCEYRYTSFIIRQKYIIGHVCGCITLLEAQWDLFQGHLKAAVLTAGGPSRKSVQGVICRRVAMICVQTMGFKRIHSSAKTGKCPARPTKAASHTFIIIRHRPRYIFYVLATDLLAGARAQVEYMLQLKAGN